jgi:hypothetical protein
MTLNEEGRRNLSITLINAEDTLNEGVLLIIGGYKPLSRRAL